MLQRTYKKLCYASVLFVSLISVTLLCAHTSYAAILSISPVSSVVSVGSTISLKVDVDSAGTAINTAGATITFPTDLLEVVSVGDSTSIFSLWVQNPAFSNDAGTVTFTGGLPTPGYAGNNGQIISIVFRAKKKGTASVAVTNGSVLANDGSGTEVLTAKGSAVITINSSAPTKVVAAGALPPLPIITSATDPQQNVWYSGTSASFSWVIPTGVTSIQTLLSKEEDSVPTVMYDNSVSQRTLDDISDGVYFFHLRYMNPVGWGPTATYKVEIDSTPPQNFTLNVQTVGAQNMVVLDAVDAMSGIASYAVKIDGEPPVSVQESSLPDNGQYVLPTQNSGQHSLAVIAYDKAGNHTESDTTFASPAIVPPTIAVSSTSSNAVNCEATSTSCALVVNRNDAITVQGETEYPNTPIGVFVQSSNGETKTYKAMTASDGSYTLVTDPLDAAGTLSVWSQLLFSDGAKSPISDKVAVRVNEGYIVETSRSIIYDLSFALPALLLILAFIYLAYEGWHKFFGLKKRLEKEAQDAVNDVHKSLDIFKDELENQLAKLEDTKNDRELSKKEEKIFRELRLHIDDIDEFIEKKIKRMR